MMQYENTEYVDAYISYCELFIEKIGQSVRYIKEIRRESFSDNIMYEYSPHIPNREIFELPADFISQISVNVWVILMKLKYRVFLITMYLCT